MKTNIEIEKEKKDFLASIPSSKRDVTPQQRALRSAIKTAVQRSIGHPVYAVPMNERKEAVSYWRSELVRLGQKYVENQQNMDTFIADVEALQTSINNSPYKHCFTDDHIRVGQCQKSLSIYLKWLWTENEKVSTPPVCPIDGVVLKECKKILKNHKDTIADYAELKQKVSIAWTNLDSMECYKDLVNIVKLVAKLEGFSEMAEWELFLWERNSQND